jgi:putative ABC transport system substrate-binding protein
MQRRDFIVLLGGAAVAWPLGVRAQQGGARRKIAIVMSTNEGDPEGKIRLDAFVQALHELGWTSGGNAEITVRWIAGDAARIRAAATEFKALKPDIILATTTPVVAALRELGPNCPIVFVVVSDPVGSGFVESLARPGGNITGFINIEASLGGKWLELLKEIAPRTKRVALLFNPETAPYVDYYLIPFKAAAASVGIVPLSAPVRAVSEIGPTIAALAGVRLTALGVKNTAEIEPAISGFAREPNGGLLVLPNPITIGNRKEIAALAIKHRLPAIYAYRYFVTDGGLMSYGAEPAGVFRRAAGYVDRILKGEKPGDLPVQAPTQYELVINLKTAKALGLTVPPQTLARADEVIE